MAKIPPIAAPWTPATDRFKWTFASYSDYDSLRRDRRDADDGMPPVDAGAVDVRPEEPGACVLNLGASLPSVEWANRGADAGGLAPGPAFLGAGVAAWY